MSIEIVPIHSDHIEGFHAALDTVARESRRLAMTEAPPIEQTRIFVMTNIERGFPQFVAVSLGDVVGWCDIIPKGIPSTSHCGVFGIAVLQPFRGRGVARALIGMTLSAARAFGLQRIELTVHADNTRAMRLYERTGFVAEGVMHKARRIDGRYKDVVIMAIADFDRWSAPAVKI